MNKLLSVAFLSVTLSLPVTAACISEDLAERSKPSAIYAEHGDGTVTDLETGLMWSKCELGKSGERCEQGQSDGSVSWQQALDKARLSDLADYDDWRLPNIKELESIVESSCIEPPLNAHVFENASSKSLWSSSVRHYDDGLNNEDGNFSVWVLTSNGYISAMEKIQ